MLVAVATLVGGFAVLAVAFEAPFAALVAGGGFRIGYSRKRFTDRAKRVFCCFPQFSKGYALFRRTYTLGGRLMSLKVPQSRTPARSLFAETI
jgi:hypothetical protein